MINQLLIASAKHLEKCEEERRAQAEYKAKADAQLVMEWLSEELRNDTSSDRGEAAWAYLAIRFPLLAKHLKFEAWWAEHYHWLAKTIREATVEEARLQEEAGESA